MYGNYEYKFDEAEESDRGMTDTKCEVVCEQNDKCAPSKSFANCCTLPEVATACQPSPVRFMTSHSDCVNTATGVKAADLSLAGQDNTVVTIGLENTGSRDVTVCGAEKEMSLNGRENDSASSRSDVDETGSFTNHSMICDGQQDVDWSELASARAALQSSDESSSTTAQWWTSDDEEPELLNLLVDNLTEMVDSNPSDDYEEETQEHQACDCDSQPDETQERHNLIVNENGTFEEVCLSSSTYYFACLGQDDGRGSCFVFGFGFISRCFTGPKSSICAHFYISYLFLFKI